MPRYHLNLAGPRSIVPDEEGAEFESLEYAYLEAFKGAREMWHELLLQREDPRAFSFEITDAAGASLMTVPLAEVLEGCRRAGTEPKVDAAPEPRSRHRSARRDYPDFCTTAHAAKARAGQVQQQSAELKEQLLKARASLELTRNLIQTRGPSDLW